MKKKITIVIVIILIVSIFLISINMNPDKKKESILCEGFENETGIITKIPESNLKLVIEDGILHLNADDKERGGGIWSKNLSIEFSPGSKISWQWTGNDLGKFQFWIKVKFNNNRAIYYVADNSITPGYVGERYRDSQGRIRLMPSTIILGNPIQEKKWTKVERNLGQDYKRYCGDIHRDLYIIRISAGMVDDDIEHKNELMIDNITLNLE